MMIAASRICKQEGSMIATTEVEVDALPEEVADAWATVLLDIYEKRRQSAVHDSSHTIAEKGDDECPTTSRAKQN
jgi:hypothetical protein